MKRNLGRGILLLSGLVLFTLIAVDLLFYAGVVELNLFWGGFFGVCVCLHAARQSEKRGAVIRARRAELLALALTAAMAALFWWCKPAYTTGRAIQQVTAEGHFTQVSLSEKLPTMPMEQPLSPLVQRGYILICREGEEERRLFFQPMTGEYFPL
ncbi:MAG: hypothetical protein ACI3U8_06505 [Candidatus Onthomonas sp.]